MPDNYPAAAEKHTVDAEALLQVNRFDGAGYLAGYAVECVIKTLIQVENAKAPKHHDVTSLSTQAAHLASQASQKTAKYLKLQSITSLVYGATPGAWKEILRYEALGVVPEAVARSWVVEARRLYLEVIVQMKLDGVSL